MTARQRTRIAIVGLGHAANDFHLPCLSKFEDVELILRESWAERLDIASQKVECFEQERMQ